MVAANQLTFRNIPITVRLKAWWEGLPAEALQPPKKPATATATTTVPFMPPKTPAPTVPSEPWSAAAVEAAQTVWGNRFCGPSNASYLEELSDQLEIKPHTSILQLGAQLGGQAQTLADRYKIKVRALEASSELLKLGGQHGTEKRSSANMCLSAYDPENFQGFENKFEGAFSQEALFTVKGKRALLAQVEDQLRPGSRLSLTEYMLAPSARLGKEVYQNWVKHERRMPHPVSLEEMKDILSDLKLDIEVSQDISPQYNSMIKKAWTKAGKFAAKLAEKPEGIEKIRAITKEAEIWQAREQIIDSGDIGLWRIVARKKPALRMLSDW